jgi:tRNA (cytidine/uridine-2'-O-)-methyltransferase
MHNTEFGSPLLHLALFQPDQPGNTGTLLRTCACFGVPVHIIEPCGFPFSDKALARAGMDYLPNVEIRRHLDWAAFDRWRAGEGRRLVLLTTRGAVRHIDFAYRNTDVLMVGQESNGVPDAVHGVADARLVLPLQQGMRSLNVAVAAAMVLGEALRQTDGFSS